MAVRIIPAQQMFQGTGPNQEKRQLRVAAYARVSTELEDQESSYEAQVNHYTEYITNHDGWVLAGVFADEGISGTSTAKREQFNRLIKSCEKGEVDMVITKSISRWARNTLDSLNYIRKLKDLGIAIVFEKEGINTMRASGELLITIMSSLAQQESQSISQNVRMGLQYGFQQGKPMLAHTRFLGYTKNRGDKALTIVPEEADIVRNIFRDFLEGFSFGEIVKKLMDSGIPTPGKGKKWRSSTVKSMLENEKFMGDLLLQKSYTVDFLTKKSRKNDGQFPQYYVENAHPPIVPREIFQRVQGMLMQMEHDRLVSGKQNRRANETAIFGKVTCGQCGDRYVRYIQNGTFIWRCRTRAKCRYDCIGRQVIEAEVMAAMVTAFNRLTERREDLIRMQERIMWGPLDRIDREIKEIDKNKNELEKVISSYASTGNLEKRILFRYCKEGEEIDEETAISRMSEEIARMKDKRDALICEKGELGFQEANIQTLFKLTNAILGMPLNTRTMIKTGTDNAAAGDAERDPAACYDVHDFYERTDNITQRGPVKEYDNELTRRFVDRFVIQPEGIDVRFKAGITINVKTPEWAMHRKRSRKRKVLQKEEPAGRIEGAC